jgi:predicted CopG family antitoxin
MGHKTITISEEAYKALAKLKQKRESFTEAILRLTGKRNTGTLLEYVRSLEPDEELARILEEIVEERKKITLRVPRL